MNKIIPIPAFNDNYIWLSLSKDEQSALVVDPGDAQPVIDYVQQYDLNLTTILITHHHWDHTGGIDKLRNFAENVQVYGPKNDNITNLDHLLVESDIVSLPEFDLKLNVLEIPGHTLGHIAYYDDEILFSGDTLFSAGCGRVFEGTNPQMYGSLLKLKNLNKKLKVYCGHEYTENNLQFALSIEPDNDDLKSRLKEVQALRAQNHPSLPSTLATELKTNPFLRADDPKLIEAVKKCDKSIKTADPVDVFSFIRSQKDQF